MQTWAKRGVKTALVTGGLLMLGTGIASANENVSPDSPAGPLDINATLPIQIEQNALGLPLGKQLNLPGYTGEISTKPITGPLSGATAPLHKAAAPAAKATAPLAGVASKATDALSSATGKAGASRATQGVDGLGLESNGDAFKGNKIDLDLVAPIQICGNAIGVIGDAAVDGSDCVQTYENDQDTVTDGSHSGLAGNVVALDWALPVQIAGNAGGLAGGSGYAAGTAEQKAVETGNISTDGTGSGLSGNVVAPQFATPVQVTGNAASWILANAYSEYDAETEAEAGGWIQTNGDGGAGTGNVVGVPIALPVKLNGVAAGAWGSDADTVSHSEADATAGDTTPGLNDIPAYITTEGDKAFLAGTVVQPQGALVANVAGVAASWIGNATTGNAQGDEAPGSSSSEVEAGGFSSTTGQDGAATGNIVDLPVALPVEAFGIGGTYIGNAHAAHDNETSAVAGEGTYTTGDGSLGSANTITGQPALTAELFGIGGSHIGNASGTSTEEKLVQSGGYNGSTGNDSSASGNIIQVPVAVPAEIFGVGGSYIGQGHGTAEETKVINAGGGGNTDDDNGLLSSNLVSSPLAIPAQVFGIGASHIGRGSGQAVTDTQVTAGDEVKATGDKAGASGNIGFLPVAFPVQVHGIGGSFIGTGFGASENLTDAQAGGDATTGGEEGAVAGNLIQAPIAGAANVFGSSAALAGLVGGQTAENDVVSQAGGDSATNGDGGALAGNIVSAQALPLAQVFGDAVAAASKAGGAASNTTDVTSGGDVTTSGEEGAVSGNILDIPAAAVVQIFGDAVAGAGVANALADNTTTGQVGGESTTSGTMNSLSGLDGQLPVGVVAQVWDVPLALLGVANATAENSTDIGVSDDEPQIDLGIDGSELPLDAVPNLNWPSLPSVPGVPGIGGGSGSAGLPMAGLPAAGLPELSLPTTPGLPALPGGTSLPTLPGVPSLPGLPSLPVGKSAQRADLPLEISGLDVTNGLPTDVLAGGLPVDLLGGGLPVDMLTGGLPTGLPTTAPMTGAAMPVNPADLLPQADVAPLGFFSKFLGFFGGK